MKRSVALMRHKVDINPIFFQQTHHSLDSSLGVHPVHKDVEQCLIRHR